MREEGLEVVYNRRRRRWSSYAGEVSAAPPNLVARDFSAPAPDELWVTDITEFRIPAGKAYLSAVVDCFDGRPAGWRIGPSPTAALANGSLADAVAARRAGARTVVHSDRVLPPMYFPPFTPMIHNRSRQPAPAGYANVFPPLSAPPPNLSRNARASRARALSEPG